jgi:hypothetical protein
MTVVASDQLDGDLSGMRSERLDVGPVSGEDGAAGLSERDDHRIDRRTGSRPAA